MSNAKPQLSDRSRLILAVALSLLIFSLFQFYNNWQQSKNPPPEPVPAQTSTTDTPAENDISRESALDSETRFNAEEQASTRIFSLSNQKLAIYFSEKTAAIVSNFFLHKRYSNEVVNFEDNYLEGFNSAALRTGNDLMQSSFDTRYKLEKQGSNTISFIGELNAPGLNQPLKVRKQFILNDYKLNTDITLLNPNDQPAKLYLLNGSSIGPQSKEQKGMNNAAIEGKYLGYVLVNDYSKIFGPGKLQKPGDLETKQSEGPVEWLALNNRFFVQTLVDRQKVRSASFVKYSEDGVVYPISAIQWTLSPGEKDYSFEYFFLPKRRSLLNSLYESENIQFFRIYRYWKFLGLGQMFKLLSDFFDFLLRWIYDFVGNWGWAIIILTILVKVVTFPLTYRSMVSMQKMQALQPKVKAIQEKHKKKNSQQANQEMMALYRKEKVNPAGGCLPMFIPLPIFIALYTLFRGMEELNHESFYWIADLGLPDTIYTMGFNLPFIGNQINLLPLIMTVTAFFQSALTPQAANTANSQQASQAAMMKWMMPTMFFFISYNMPAALVLYWTVQNFFSILQSALIKRTIKRGEAEKA